jgi:hypothetical protein
MRRFSEDHQMKDEALKLALEALEIQAYNSGDEKYTQAITAIKQALAAPTVQEPVAWMFPDDLKRFETSEAYAEAYSIKMGSPTQGQTVPLYATPPAAQPAQQEPDWKAEYLKSVESGCITLDELREANAELVATNRQVEILSDALAESRREVASLKANAALDKKAENARELGLDYEPHKGLSEHLAQATNGRVRIDPVTGDVGIGTPAAQPAVPDAFGTREGEHPQYVQGWNDCRAEMLKGMK